MKKHLAVLLLLAVMGGLCTGCSTPPAPQASARPLGQIYAEMDNAGVLPVMMSVDPDMALDFFGIDVSTCTESVIMISEDSMLADEVVLLRARDQAAADECKALLDARLEAKAAEAKGYSPEQYAIIMKGKVLQSGTDLALIVSPEADQLLKIYQK